MRKPFLPSDLTAERGLDFIRATIAQTVARNAPNEAAGIASERWGAESRAVRIVKAAGAAGTVNGNWGGPLSGEYATAAAEFMGLVRKQSILGRLTGMRRVPARVPILTQTGGFAGHWVREGAAMRVGKAVFARQALDTLKVAAMCVVTEELIESGDPLADAIIKADLTRAIAEASDLAFIDPANAGVNGETPASVTNGVEPITAVGDFKIDLDRLVSSFAGDLTTAVLIGRPELFVQVAGIEFPNVGARGGEMAGIPAIPSRSVPNNADGSYRLNLIDPAGIVYAADDAATQIKSTHQGTIEMSEAPLSNAITPTASAQVSLWQNNLMAIAGLMHENWRQERRDSVAVLSSIHPTQPVA
ncbi:phage major capsid protein [Sphingomonas sp. CFBP 8764]|uniref:phage major capsid protein n=1 Tax=Sphingomonas sp. CFBP 8764 TaxID=2775275 RepID=UPI00177B9ED4|nr:phage major capsid protein [Sphingomonas sp. CFBP 8764]MBD8552448.1 phage major capsid protein [Sphingomonas sp. CFBP 8764]